jgi:hypothetical protein
MACSQIFATGIEVTNNEVVLSFNRVPAITSTGFFCFRFSENLTLPSNYANLPVYANVTVNGTATLVPIYDKYGNVMAGSEIILNSNGGICTRYVYRVYTGLIGTDYHLVFSNVPKIENHSI